MSCFPNDSSPTSPRPKRRTAKAAAETISKALENSADDSGEEEFTLKLCVPGVPPSSPKSKPRPASSNKRRSASSSCSGKKSSLSAEVTDYLKKWMLSPDHIDHPYPTEEEKAEIMKHCGIEMKQLTNWFVNNRKRIWKPKYEEIKRSRGESGPVVLPLTASNSEQRRVEERDAKRKKTAVCSKPAKVRAGVKALNKKPSAVKVPSSLVVNNPLDVVSMSPIMGGMDCDLSIAESMPPLPPLQGSSEVATVTPTVDPTIISSFAEDIMASAPLLPMPSAEPFEPFPEHIMPPHSCETRDLTTGKMNHNNQPCALCSACRDWNAGEFCPWDLTGIIGNLSDDSSVTGLAEITMDGAKEGDNSASIVSEEPEAFKEGGNSTSVALSADAVFSSKREEVETDINAFPSRESSFAVPQEIGQMDMMGVIDIDVWD